MIKGSKHFDLVFIMRISQVGIHCTQYARLNTECPTYKNP